MSNQAVVVDAVRTPMGRGKAGGALSGVHPSELLATVLRALIERNDVDPGSVDDVLIGCVSQAGEQSNTPGRMAWKQASCARHATLNARAMSSPGSPTNTGRPMAA